MKRLLLGILFSLSAACIGSIATAETLLTVVAADGANPVTFSRAYLEAIGQAEILTANEFVDGKKTFRGPLVHDVLAASGAGTASMLRLTAANDYQVEFEVAEARKYEAILAMTMDGKRLSLRDKGPIWVIYPMSDYAELRDPVYNSRLIWQLVKIEYW